MRHVQLLALAVGGGLWAPPVRAEGPSPEELQKRYAGEYRFVGGTAERERVPAAVEHSVDGMFFISRGIAYDRLMKNCEVCTTYSLNFLGGEVVVASPCQWTDRSPDDGREVPHTTKLGDTSQLSQRFVDGALVQFFRGEEGSRRVVYTLAPDGTSLSVHVTIASKHLPHPVEYSLSYRRIPPPASDAGRLPGE